MHLSIVLSSSPRTRPASSKDDQVGYVASNSRANIIVVADEEQLAKVMQVAMLILMLMIMMLMLMMLIILLMMMLMLMLQN